MEYLITHIAHNNDLYEILFRPDKEITKVVLYPDNNGQKGVDLAIWELPVVVREKIQDKIEEYLS